MSLFIIEAAVVGLKEALKLWVVWLVLSAYLKDRGAPRLTRAFHLGIALTTALFAVSFAISSDPYVRVMLSRLTGYTFFIFFISSIAALLESTGTRLFAGLKPPYGILRPLTALSTVFYFSPDIIGSSMFIRELSEMKGAYAAVYLSGFAGFALPFILTALTLCKYRGSRTAAIAAIAPYFGTAQFLLFLSMVKLLGGGIKGFAEFSLIPMVQRGVMKFFHDFVHQTFVFLMVPDHPLLATTVWNFIGIFFGPNIAMAASLFILLLPPAMFLYKSLPTKAEAGDYGSATGAERRKLMASVRADRRKKAVPVVGFIALILIFYFSGGAGEVSRLYNPKPKPVVEDKGVIIIPLTDPTMDLMDGMLHKFSFAAEGKTMNLLIIKKPDGKLALCLDACEICPPEGYGQREGHVVCIYCMTPIPVETLGRPGGCNPIPVNASITEKDIRVDVAEIIGKWQKVGGAGSVE